MNCSFSYTCAVVWKAFGLGVVNREVFRPGTRRKERGLGRAAEMGRQPRKAV